MRIVDISTARFDSAFGIDMASISQLGEKNCIGAAYGIVLPGQETMPHKHDEIEVFVILDGVGEVIVDSQIYPVCASTVILFEPFESHVLRNTGISDLKFADFYWRFVSQRASVAASNAYSPLQNRPIFVFSTPPTPNGDLHLGHLSGPYLGADVYVRFLRANGLEAYHLTGSDDYQSYVVGRARQEQSTPQEIASRYATEIKDTLDLMGIHLDQYTISSEDPLYASGLQSFFSYLVSAGVGRVRGPALFDSHNNAYLYEVDVVGNCPICKSASNGNICEECGEPNICVDLIAPRSKLSDMPPRQGEIERYTIHLGDFKNVVQIHHKRGKISPKLQQLAESILTRKDFSIPITHPAEWGVTPIEPLEDKQVIWAWPEMAYGFLYSIGELGRRLGRDWCPLQPQADWKIVHFFGYDNSFYHSILYPILYHLAFPEWQCDIDYNENEFYLLDGLKFSTSKRHVIWAKDIVTPDNVDAFRYYLAWTRGEQERTNFSLVDFYHCVDQILVGQWQFWLTEIGNHVHNDFAGRVPDAGSWTPSQIGYLNSLENFLSTIKTFYDANSFSLNHVIDELNALVKAALQFSKSYKRIRSSVSNHDEYRTAVALELATAALLAKITAPLMPQFASRLGEALGGLQVDNWPMSVELIVVGNKIDLSNRIFFKTKKTHTV